MVPRYAVRRARRRKAHPEHGTAAHSAAAKIFGLTVLKVPSRESLRMLNAKSAQKFLRMLKR